MAGYDKPLYILPFDHRRSYGSEVFGFNDPLSQEQIAQIAASKRVIFDGFKKGLESGVPKEKAGILVDEEFGAAILRDAAKEGIAFAMCVGSSIQIALVIAPVLVLASWIIGQPMNLVFGSPLDLFAIAATAPGNAPASTCKAPLIT